MIPRTMEFMQALKGMDTADGLLPEGYLAICREANKLQHDGEWGTLDEVMASLPGPYSVEVSVAFLGFTANGKANLPSRPALWDRTLVALAAIEGDAAACRELNSLK